MERSSCYYFFEFAILLLLLTLSPCLAKTSTDKSALLSLKALVTSDPYQILTKNWTINSWSDVCSWIGVTCGLRHHRVTALNISSMGLSGTIPPHLGNLSFLVSLDLSYNHFGGSLPQELSSLHRVEYISLRNNSFTGFIPNSLSHLSNLLHLDFTSNSFHGEIPLELGRLDKLQILAMQHNRLSGFIPSPIFNISTLQFLALTGNELSGNLPVDMCRNLPFLQGIYLSQNQLSGKIPSNLSECQQLRIMSLSYNSLSGEIPATIGKLKSLERLALGGNNLNGVIPKEIGDLQNLIQLDMEKNNISGNLPINIFNLSSLQILGLGRNHLGGTLSRDIANLTMLRVLQLTENSFTGVLPTEMTQLYQLETLQLGFNAFVGSIPPDLFNISTLGSLDLTYNGLSGSLPTNLCYGTPLLEELYLGRNDMRGEIPSSISNCAHLTNLILISNKFTGVVPHFLGNLSLLEKLDLSINHLRIESGLSFINSLTNCPSLNRLAINDNPLGGIIPPSIGNFSSSFQYFYAYNCKLRGTIPTSVGNLSNLIILSLRNNDLSGNIPHTLYNLHKLQGLGLGSNNLDGFISHGLCDLHNINFLSLSQNQLSGPIPNCFGNLTSLSKLYLQSNIFTSTIPSSLWLLINLMELNLSRNSLDRILPPEMGNLVAVTCIDLAMNQFSETIPTTIGKLQNLMHLSLAQNRLEGSIPESVGSVISLSILDLSYNNLSGLIPKSLEKLQDLDYFNVSFNDLSGEIPTGGPFRNFTVESFKANRALCGISRFHVPLCHIPNHRSRKKKVRFALFILALVVALITVVTLAFIFIRYRRNSKETCRADEQVRTTMLERISYYEILKSTEQFSENNLLGIGSYGSVYRGVLRDGKVIAVKVFSLQSEATIRSFDVECNVLRNIRHRNLLKVISSCSNKEFRALVLEYMPMGNLEQWLYSHNYCLNVMQRLNVMIDVACALEYLHHDYSTPIVHCDLKPSNVLLDEEMVAHVSDFGITKLLGDEESIVQTNTLATLGYIAPEYGLEGLVSTRCDVYSYGVMLMETFTRKRPSDSMFGGDLTLKSWVENLLLESPGRVIDVNLLTNLDDKCSGKIMYGVSSILVLALKCSAEVPKERINMREALLELQKIKQSLQ